MVCNTMRLLSAAPGTYQPRVWNPVSLGRDPILQELVCIERDGRQQSIAGKKTRTMKKPERHKQTNNDSMDHKMHGAGVHQFAYKNLKRHSFILILHPSRELAADLVTKIMKRHRFHLGDIFTSDRAQCAPRLLYPCQSAHQMQPETFKDIFQRQAGHLKFEPTADQRETLDLLDDDGRQEYLRRLQPLHFLPRRMFGDSIPSPVFALVTRYLVIPEAYLVLHHCFSNVDSSWSRQGWMRKCLLNLQRNHQLTRVVSVLPDCAVPPTYFAACDYLFVFTKDEHALKTLFQRAKLKRFFHSYPTLAALVQQLRDCDGLVIEMQDPDATRPLQHLERGVPTVHTDRVFWTADIVRARAPADAEADRQDS